MTSVTLAFPAAPEARARVAPERPRRALRGRPPRHRRARRAAVARGLRAAVDARREPGEVASRAHDAGSSRPSCSRRTSPATRRSTRRSACCSTRTTTASARGIRGPSAACCRARRSTRCCAYRGHVDAACRRCSRHARMPRRRATRRARPAARAAAPGADPHRREAPAFAQSAAPRSTTRAGRWRACAPQPLAGIAYAGGLVTIGHDGRRASRSTTRRPRTTCCSRRSRLATHPVTHGEFPAFIDDGGYRRPELWLSRGLGRRRRARGWQAPLYWAARRARGGRSRCTAMVDIDAHTPVCHVSFFEADAYARWAGARLPTEFEWEARPPRLSRRRQFRRDAARLHPLPLRRLRDRGRAGADVRRRVGVDAQRLRALPRLSTAPGAVGEYNGKFMCNQYVLRGGTCATPASHIRATLPQLLPAGRALAVLAALRARRARSGGVEHREVAARDPASSATSAKPAPRSICRELLRRVLVGILGVDAFAGREARAARRRAAHRLRARRLEVHLDAAPPRVVERHVRERGGLEVASRPARFTMMQHVAVERRGDADRVVVGRLEPARCPFACRRRSAGRCRPVARSARAASAGTRAPRAGDRSCRSTSRDRRT